jgi:cobalt-zinc-cadmium efflux system outer membrane protein
MLPRISRAVAGVVVACVATRPVTTRADERAVAASLDEATFLQRVHERSPRQLALDERSRAARAQVGVAGVLPNPTLSYEREAVSALDDSDDFVRVGWTLDIAGRRGLAVGAARAGAEAERFDADREGQLLDIEARTAFLDALYAREHLTRLDEARATLAQLVDALRSRAKQGDASSYDADRATLELDTLDDERATARRQLETARLRMGALLGEPATPHDASGTLALPAKVEASAATPQRPDVDAALARAKQADRELRAAHRRWIPRFELVGGMKMSKTMGGDGVGYVVGIGGELPVFDAGGAAADRARADAKRWRAEARAIANDVRGEVEQARNDLRLRIEQAELYLGGPAKRASDVQQRAAVAYREGDRPILELLDVQRTARHAAVRALELIYEARRAELVLRRAVGRTR